jgi:hypothetical protein
MIRNGEMHLSREEQRELLDRMRRIELRLVKLMIHFGLDKQGDESGKAGKATNKGDVHGKL